jgi:hypothetical protein
MYCNMKLSGKIYEQGIVLATSGLSRKTDISHENNEKYIYPLYGFILYRNVFSLRN